MLNRILDLLVPDLSRTTRCHKTTRFHKTTRCHKTTGAIGQVTLLKIPE